MPWETLTSYRLTAVYWGTIVTTAVWSATRYPRWWP